jgi:hypothetical protein
MTVPRNGQRGLRICTTGLVVVVFPLALGLVVGSQATELPAKFQALEDLTGAFRPAFRAEDLADTRADMSTLSALGEQLSTDALPSLAERLGTTPEQLVVSLGEDYPAVGEGLAQLPTILRRFDTLVGRMETQADNFHEADAIPTNDLPATVVPYIGLLSGVLIAALAAVALLTGKVVRGTLRVAALVGIALVVTPLVLSMPSKAQAVDDLSHAFRPALSEEGSARLREDMVVAHALTDQLLSEALPALGGQGTRSDQVRRIFGQDLPAVVTGVEQLPRLLTRLDGLVDSITANVENFARADSIPTADLPTTLLCWLFVITGALLFVGASTAMLGARSSGARANRPPDAVLSPRVNLARRSS